MQKAQLPSAGNLRFNRRDAGSKGEYVLDKVNSTQPSYGTGR